VGHIAEHCYLKRANKPKVEVNSAEHKAYLQKKGTTRSSPPAMSLAVMPAKAEDSRRGTPSRPNRLPTKVDDSQEARTHDQIGLDNHPITKLLRKN
jgi:hypothetical protein